MSPPTLSSLPTEIKCQIMEACDTLRTVLALAQTGSLFQLTWRLHTKSICQHVLPRSLDCYEYGQTLVDIQSSVIPQGHEMDPLRGFKRMIANSYAADDVCELFSRTLSKAGPTIGPNQIRRPGKPDLTSTERARLIQTYYVTRIFLAGLDVVHWNSWSQGGANDCLASISPRELWRVRELMSWFEMLNNHGLNSLQLESSSDLRYLQLDSSQELGFAAFRKTFQKNFRSTGNRDPYAPGTVHYNAISSFFDECQHYLESLADTIT